MDIQTIASTLAFVLMALTMTSSPAASEVDRAPPPDGAGAGDEYNPWLPIFREEAKRAARLVNEAQRIAGDELLDSITAGGHPQLHDPPQRRSLGAKWYAFPGNHNIVAGKRSLGLKWFGFPARQPVVTRRSIGLGAKWYGFPGRVLTKRSYLSNGIAGALGKRFREKCAIIYNDESDQDCCQKEMLCECPSFAQECPSE